MSTYRPPSSNQLTLFVLVCQDQRNFPDTNLFSAQLKPHLFSLLNVLLHGFVIILLPLFHLTISAQLDNAEPQCRELDKTLNVSTCTS